MWEENTLTISTLKFEYEKVVLPHTLQGVGLSVYAVVKSIHFSKNAIACVYHS